MKDSKTKKYGIVIDSSKCIDCKACMVACKVENNIPEGFWRNWIRPLWDISDSRKTEFQPGQCMQCDTPSCVVTCPTKARTFGDIHDPDSEVSRMVKGEKLVRVNAPHVNTQPNIYYREGTRLLDWAVTPTLPGNVHMDREFWEKSG